MANEMMCTGADGDRVDLLFFLPLGQTLTPADVTATDGNPLNLNFHASGIFTISGGTS